MNIAILTPTKNQAGGVERFSFYLRDTLEKKGHVVQLIGNEDLTSFEKFILSIKKRFGMQQPALGYFLGRKAIKGKYDVYITNGMLGWNISGRKVINVQHGTFARSADRIDRHRSIIKYFVKKYVWGFFEGLAARRSTACVAVSEETKESVTRYYDVENVRVILNAVDTQLFHPVNRIKKNQAIFVGRFEHAKGKDILEGVKVYLEQKGWQLLVAEKLSQEDLATAYNESQVFLLPSLHEGCSYALLDAMACGLPFLASPVGLIPEFEHAGLFSECVVHEQTVEAYCATFDNLIGMTDFDRNILGHNLRNYILEKHNLELFSNHYCAIIESL